LAQLPFEPQPPAGSPGERRVYTVSELNREACALLEEAFWDVWVEGEVSNFRLWRTGHWYFSLKDEGAVLDAVMFASANAGVRFTPRDGTKVVARGRLQVYEAKGRFQIQVSFLEPAGRGALQLAYEQLCERLRAEGLFEEARKRPLPLLPRVVGIVTSADGAALRDIVRTVRRRYANLGLVLAPARVQGEGAAEEIAEGIRALNRLGGVDVMIVGRGGGSIEDLWAFNEEAVARAIAASRIPVISAVGHETDFTIADFVADLRAPTPSAAAELVVPDREEWLRSVANSLARLITAMRRALAERNESLDWRVKRLQQLHPAARLAQRAQRLDELEQRMALAVRRELSGRGHRLSARRADLARHSPVARLAALGQRATLLSARLAAAARARLAVAQGRGEIAARALHAVSPLATLARGYAIVQVVDGPIVTDAAQAPPGTDIEARLAKGTLRARVQ